MAKSRKAAPTERTEPQVQITNTSPCLLALAEHRFAGQSHEAVLFAVANEFGMDYTGQGGIEEIVSLEHGIFTYVNNRGRCYQQSEVLMHLLTHGDIIVMRYKYTLEDEETFNTKEAIEINDIIKLEINGQPDVSVPTETKDLIIEAMTTVFTGQSVNDYSELGWLARCRAVMKCYHALVENPRDSLQEVMAQIRAATGHNRDWSDPVCTPEYIGKKYVEYLKMCIEEDRPPNMIKSLSSYIKSNRWMENSDGTKPSINLYDQPSHEQARSIFNEATDIMKNEASKNHPETPGETDDEEDGEGAPVGV